MHAMHLLFYGAKQPSLKLKMQPKHLLVSNPLDVPAQSTNFKYRLEALLPIALRVLNLVDIHKRSYTQTDR